MTAARKTCGVAVSESPRCPSGVVAPPRVMPFGSVCCGAGYRRLVSSSVGPAPGARCRGSGVRRRGLESLALAVGLLCVSSSACALTFPNETKLSHRWRERALLRSLMLKSSES